MASHVEHTRQQFRPDKIQLLLIGESPPENGVFFYDGCAMTTYTAKAFENAFSTRYVDTHTFLTDFKKRGGFLDDLSHIPVDKLSHSEREATLVNNIEALAKRIQIMKPACVITLLKKIEKHIDEAVKQCGLKIEIYHLPFPGCGHQNQYVKGLTDILIARQ